MNPLSKSVLFMPDGQYIQNVRIASHLLNDASCLRCLCVVLSTDNCEIIAHVFLVECQLLL